GWVQGCGACGGRRGPGGRARWFRARPGYRQGVHAGGYLIFSAIALAAASALDLASAPPMTPATALPNGSQTAAISGIAGRIAPSLPAARNLARSGSEPLTWS